MIDLTDRAALVTGGGQGVGEAIALVLAQQGADVAIGDVQVDRAEKVAEEVRRRGRLAFAFHLDVSSRASARKAAARVVSEWGRIDILVNNAGVAGGPADAAGDGVEATWDHVLAINVKGVVNCTDAVMPYMAEARYGKIINIASVAGKPGDPIWMGASGPAPEDASPPLGGSAYGRQQGRRDPAYTVIRRRSRRAVQHQRQRHLSFPHDHTHGAGDSPGHVKVAERRTQARTWSNCVASTCCRPTGLDANWNRSTSETWQRFWRPKTPET